MGRLGLVSLPAERGFCCGIGRFGSTLLVTNGQPNRPNRAAGISAFSSVTGSLTLLRPETTMKAELLPAPAFRL